MCYVNMAQPRGVLIANVTFSLPDREATLDKLICDTHSHSVRHRNQTSTHQHSHWCRSEPSLPQQHPAPCLASRPVRTRRSASMALRGVWRFESSAT